MRIRRRLLGSRLSPLRIGLIAQGLAEPSPLLVQVGFLSAVAGDATGVAAVPCFIEDMTDEAAHKRLVKENRQSELSKLEIGLYLRDTVKESKGGRGKKGGLSAAAAEIGISLADAKRLVSAAEVYIHIVENLAEINLANVGQVSIGQVLMDQHSYLAEIANAPQAAWIPLVQWLLDDPKKATIEKIKAKVKVIKQAAASIPDWWDVDVAKLAAPLLSLAARRDATRIASRRYQSAINLIPAWYQARSL